MGNHTVLSYDEHRQIHSGNKYPTGTRRYLLSSHTPWHAVGRRRPHVGKTHQQITK